MSTLNIDIRSLVEQYLHNYLMASNCSSLQSIAEMSALSIDFRSLV
jgi:hypothetical protein